VAASAWSQPSSKPPRWARSGPRPWSGWRHQHPRRATALRALADALVEAADLADDYDADPDAFNERERADRDLAGD
jgi:hypothetical protein